ncbi:MAG: hypothetical protein JKX83_02595 [Pseudomonadales bacterium]|nr:hypothetical protein [Pseudomonadales bacterium]
MHTSTTASIFSHYQQRGAKGPLIVALCLLLNGCSGFQFLYNQLDWLALNQANHYLNLNDQQQQQLEKEIAQLLHWHRTTQLIKYTQLLNETAVRAQKPLTEADFGWAETQMGVLYVELMEPAIAPIAKVLSTLDDEQIQYLSEQLSEELQEQYEYLDYSSKKRLQHRTGQLIDQFENGYDDLTDQQLAILKKHAEENLDLSSLAKQYRQQINRELIALLAAPQTNNAVNLNSSQLPTQPQHSEHSEHSEHYANIEKYLRTIWLHPETNYPAEYLQAINTTKTNYYQLMQEIHALVTPNQLQHLLETIASYNQDFMDLSSAARTAPIALQNRPTTASIQTCTNHHKSPVSKGYRHNNC